MRLSPLDPLLVLTRSGTASAHFFLGRYDEAASWAAMALQDNPDFQPGLRIAAASNAMVGRPEQAHEAIARLRQVNPALRVSNLKNLVGPIGGPKTSHDMKKDCGELGCPNEHRSQCSPVATRIDATKSSSAVPAWSPSA